MPGPHVPGTAQRLPDQPAAAIRHQDPGRGLYAANTVPALCPLDLHWLLLQQQHLTPRGKVEGLLMSSSTYL